MTHERTPEDMLQHMTGGALSGLRNAVLASRAQRTYRELEAVAHKKTGVAHSPLEIIQIYDGSAGSQAERHFFFMQTSRGVTIARLPQPDGEVVTFSADFECHPTAYAPLDIANMAIIATAMEERLARMDEPGVVVKLDATWHTK